jgi:tetratricopeptide (TPR) repeat protein
VPEPVSHETAALWEAERLMHGGSFELAVEILHNVVDRGPTLQAICMLASSYLELGEHSRALHYASVAVEREPSSVPARAVLARVNVALGHYASALSDYDAVAALSCEQHPIPPDKFSIPAHFALHNVEQLDHILTTGNCDAQALAGVFTEELPGLRRRLTDIIDGANGEAPMVSVQGRNSRVLADPRTCGLQRRSCHDT